MHAQFVGGPQDGFEKNDEWPAPNSVSFRDANDATKFHRYVPRDSDFWERDDELLIYVYKETYTRS